MRGDNSVGKYEVYRQFAGRSKGLYWRVSRSFVVFFWGEEEESNAWKTRSQLSFHERLLGSRQLVRYLLTFPASSQLVRHCLTNSSLIKKKELAHELQIRQRESSAKLICQSPRKHFKDLFAILCTLFSLLLVCVKIRRPISKLVTTCAMSMLPAIVALAEITRLRIWLTSSFILLFIFILP